MYLQPFGHSFERSSGALPSACAVAEVDSKTWKHQLVPNGSFYELNGPVQGLCRALIINIHTLAHDTIRRSRLRCAPEVSDTDTQPYGCFSELGCPFFGCCCNENSAIWGLLPNCIP